MSSTVQKKTYAITITPDEEDGGFVGRCDELHANSQGEACGETIENVREAVELAARVSGNTGDFDLLITQRR